jgi:hypothetical protein
MSLANKLPTHQLKEMRNEMKRITVQCILSTGETHALTQEIYSDSQALAVLSGINIGEATIKSFEIVEAI